MPGSPRRQIPEALGSFRGWRSSPRSSRPPTARPPWGRRSTPSSGPPTGRRSSCRHGAGRSRAGGGQEPGRRGCDGRRARLRRLRRRRAPRRVHPDPGRVRATLGWRPSSAAMTTRSPARIPSARFATCSTARCMSQRAGEAQTFWAGLGAVRRERFLEAGGFDAGRYPAPAIEDIELGLRLTDAGHRILLDPADPGDAPEALEPAGDGQDRPALARRPVGEADGRTALGAAGSEPGAAAPGQRPGLGGARRRGRPAGARGRRRPHSLSWSRSTAPSTRRLWRAGGPRLGLAGPGLHVVHHLSAVAAVPLGIALHLLRR